MMQIIKQSTKIAVLILLSFIGCRKSSESNSSSDNRLTPEQIQEIKQQYINYVAQNITGTWSLKQVDIKALGTYRLQEAGISKDTVIQDFATLSIDKCSSELIPQLPHATGTLLYNNVSIPISFRLVPGFSNITELKGPYAFFLFEFTSVVDQRNQIFLENIGLFGSNFSIEQLQNKDMVWKNLNHSSDGLVEAILKKN